MSKDIYLGVDGGGTKTAFILEKDGEVFLHKEGTIHLSQISREEFKKRIGNAVENLTKQAGISSDEIAYTFVSVPGYGQYPEDEAFIDESLREILGTDNFKVGNDCLNAWAGSLNAKPGINLILGTGSIGFGLDDKGNSLRCGGWGPLISDESSGYYLGLRLINYFTKQSDGRIPKTMLYDLMKEELKITDDFEIIPMAEGMTRDELASVSKILGKLIENKDECALELIDKAGYEAALTINTLAKNLNFEGKVLASYSGGVFNLGEALIGKIKQYLDSNIDLVKPYADPTQGALILAKKFFQENK
ncbi:BadF/BadG/BcrA/BcrD ATPase family protein [Anaerococcus lactolyticus ATCC 51172]|uniref:BadF/BadG/BcrA/BcrD ATPase family protein n=1 Tax=Anaerococcus lactolyticus ATCC 51172 TaxID=525254 RepID=C2BGG1_9FIRM|nr:BadF/BadG/BcrA/BcrD ATPase family protein [Anaerococcus lactolyticus]EEI86088.1 BadF/BadG/BcrA/BcrD ATPase family protein [Anaerococcus lactolyticus ATCC 51172]